MSSRPDIDALSAAELKSLVLQLLEEVAELRRTVAAQRDEIARLKGGPGRPHIKPSGLLGAGFADPRAGHPFPPGMLADPRRPDGDGARLLGAVADSFLRIAVRDDRRSGRRRWSDRAAMVRSAAPGERSELRGRFGQPPDRHSTASGRDTYGR
jgi:hypothetical protein